MMRVMVVTTGMRAVQTLRQAGMRAVQAGVRHSCVLLEGRVVLSVVAATPWRCNYLNECAAIQSATR